MCRFDDDPETIATTSGRAIPDIEVRCVDRDGSEVPRGQPGEVVVRGYNVMQGYFEDPAATAQAIDGEGWLHTGDIGVMDERGYLRITDRIKDMFITGGFNCYPAEIESLMHAHEAIAQVAVIGVPDERQGEVGMAYVVPRPGAAVDRRVDHRLVSRAHGQLQGAALRRAGGRAADECLREGDEVRLARARRGAGASRWEDSLSLRYRRADFPILQQTVHGKPLVYLDNAATTQKPQPVIDALAHFYAAENANIHRGVHALSERATDAYDAARATAQRFVNAREAARDRLRPRHDRGDQPGRPELRATAAAAGRRDHRLADGAPRQHRSLAAGVPGDAAPRCG